MILWISSCTMCDHSMPIPPSLRHATGVSLSNFPVRAGPHMIQLGGNCATTTAITAFSPLTKTTKPSDSRGTAFKPTTPSKSNGMPKEVMPVQSLVDVPSSLCANELVLHAQDHQAVGASIGARDMTLASDHPYATSLQNGCQAKGMKAIVSAGSSAVGKRQLNPEELTRYCECPHAL